LPIAHCQLPIEQQAREASPSSVKWMPDVSSLFNWQWAIENGQLAYR
jgi:hypothetical protein